MPAQDAIHDIVKTALIKDGWKITHDPYTIEMGSTHVFADLGAEKIIAAEKGKRKIVVEIKSFIGLSMMDELEKAIGKFKLYSSWVARTEPERTVYLAVSELTFNDVFDTIGGRALIEDLELKLILVSLARQEVTKWIE
ncbi:MAG: XisH family protein [Chloroflexi bacterium]|nr:XisH family protein [Chloroflexota bacterium]